MEGTLGISGTLTTELIKGYVKAPLAWRLRNALRWSYIGGWLAVKAALAFSKLTGIVTITSELRAVHNRRLPNGAFQRIDHGVVSRKIVTTAGVTFLADDFIDGSSSVTTFKYHGCGTGTTEELVTQTALITECTTALSPDSTRATGTNTVGTSDYIYKTVGTLTFDATTAVTEHGILSQAATGGGTLWDRSLFSAINVVSGDSITFTYNCTFAAGS